MEKNNVGFILKKIVTNQFATFEGDDISPEDVKINVEVNFGINEIHKITACNARFQYLSGDTPFIIIHVSCQFGIEESAWNKFIEREKSVIIFPKGFMAHLAVITVGTTRGVLHAKTENTKFNKYFLPTINVNELVVEDISFAMKKVQQ
jgi:hypothetical protein